MARRNGKGIRQLIDTLRDRIIAGLEDDEVDRIVGVIDHAVSETLLDLIDAPAPPSVQRKQQPLIARPARRKRTPKGSMTMGAPQAAAHQTSIEEVAGTVLV